MANDIGIRITLNLSFEQAIQISDISTSHHQQTHLKD